MVIAHLQMAVVGGRAQHRERAALALAQRAEALQVLRQHRHHVALLRLVGPDLHRRHALFFQVHLAQMEDRAAAGVVDQLREGVGQPAGADVMDGDDGVGFAQLPAAVDDFLAAALDFRVAALHRVEVQVFAVGPGVHRRGGAAPQADQQAGAAQLDQQRAFRDFVLVDLLLLDVAQAARQHDGLVVAAHLAVHFLFEGAEVAGEVGTAELVVERRAAYRTFQHDLQRRGDAARLAVLGLAVAVLLPRLLEARDVQVGHREAGEAGLGTRTATGGAFVADLAAVAGGGAGERRNGGRVVMRLHLHQDVGGLAVVSVAVAAGLRVEALDESALYHRGIVLVGHQRALRMGVVGIADHAEQRLALLDAVDDELRVEDLVAAVLGVGLREHHQFDVAGIASQLDEVFHQVVDFVFGQREAQLGVGGRQRLAAAGQHVDAVHRLRVDMDEQFLHLVERGQHRFGHPIVQEARQNVASLFT